MKDSVLKEPHALQINSINRLDSEEGNDVSFSSLSTVICSFRSVDSLGRREKIRLELEKIYVR